MATKRDRKTAFPFIKPKGSIKKDVQQYRNAVLNQNGGDEESREAMINPVQRRESSASRFLKHFRPDRNNPAYHSEGKGLRKRRQPWSSERELPQMDQESRQQQQQTPGSSSKSIKDRSHSFTEHDAVLHLRPAAVVSSDKENANVNAGSSGGRESFRWRFSKSKQQQQSSAKGLTRTKSDGLPTLAPSTVSSSDVTVQCSPTQSSAGSQMELLTWSQSSGNLSKRSDDSPFHQPRQRLEMLVAKSDKDLMMGRSPYSSEMASTKSLHQLEPVYSNSGNHSRSGSCSGPATPINRGRMAAPAEADYVNYEVIASLNQQQQCSRSAHNINGNSGPAHRPEEPDLLQNLPYPNGNSTGPSGAAVGGTTAAGAPPTAGPGHDLLAAENGSGRSKTYGHLLTAGSVSVANNVAAHGSEATTYPVHLGNNSTVIVSDELKAGPDSQPSGSHFQSSGPAKATGGSCLVRDERSARPAVPAHRPHLSDSPGTPSSAAAAMQPYAAYSNHPPTGADLVDAGKNMSSVATGWEWGNGSPNDESETNYASQLRSSMAAILNGHMRQSSTNSNSSAFSSYSDEFNGYRESSCNLGIPSPSACPASSSISARGRFVSDSQSQNGQPQSQSDASNGYETFHQDLNLYYKQHGGWVVDADAVVGLPLTDLPSSSPPPPPPPVRDASSLKYVKYGPGHEKHPSWPMPASAAAGAAPQAAHPQSQSQRTKSWTEQTDYPKEPAATYVRPYSKRQNAVYSQLKTVMENCERIPPEAFLSKSLNENFTAPATSVYLPPYDCDGHNIDDKDYNIPSPPERDISGINGPRLTLFDGDYAKYEDIQQYSHSEGYSSYVPSESSYVSCVSGTPLLDQLRRDSDNLVKESKETPVHTGRDSVTTVVTNSSSNSSNETLRWHGSYSDISVMSGSSSRIGDGQERGPSGLVVHSAKVQAPQRHNSESVLYYAAAATAESPSNAAAAPKPQANRAWNHRVERNNQWNNSQQQQQQQQQQPAAPYRSPAAEEVKDDGPRSPPIDTSQPLSVAERIHQLERQSRSVPNLSRGIDKNPLHRSRPSLALANGGQSINVDASAQSAASATPKESAKELAKDEAPKYTYLDPEKRLRVADPTLKAIQKQALLSYYERHSGRSSSSSTLAAATSPPPLPRSVSCSEAAFQPGEIKVEGQSSTSSSPTHGASEQPPSSNASLVAAAVAAAAAVSASVTEAPLPVKKTNEPSSSSHGSAGLIPPERPPKKPHLRAPLPLPTSAATRGGISPDQEIRRIEASAHELMNLNRASAQMPPGAGIGRSRKPPAPDPPMSPPRAAKSMPGSPSKSPISVSPPLSVHSPSPVSPKVALALASPASSVRSCSPDLPPPPPPPPAPLTGEANVTADESDDPLPPPPSPLVLDVHDMAKQQPPALSPKTTYHKESYMVHRKNALGSGYRRSTDNLAAADSSVSPSSTWEKHYNVRKGSTAATLIFSSEDLTQKEASAGQGDAEQPKSFISEVTFQTSGVSATESPENGAVSSMCRSPVPVPLPSDVSPKHSYRSLMPTNTERFAYLRRISEGNWSAPSQAPSLYSGVVGGSSSNIKSASYKLSDPGPKSLVEFTSSGPNHQRSHSDGESYPGGPCQVQAPVIQEKEAAGSRGDLQPVAPASAAVSAAAKSELSVPVKPAENKSSAAGGAATKVATLPRPKRPEEVECDQLSKDLINHLPPSDKLHALFSVPDPSHATAQYVEGLLEFRLPETKTTGSPSSPPPPPPSSAPPTAATTGGRLSPQSTVTSPVKSNSCAPLPATSAYFTTSEPKAKLLTRYHNIHGSEGSSNHGSNGTAEAVSSELLIKKKEELVSRLARKLDVLRSERDLIQEEVEANEALGRMVTKRVSSLATPPETNKVSLHVAEVDKITALLLALAGRLARAQNALLTLPADADAQEKSVLEGKRDKLLEQLEEAKRLKENIDRRSRQVDNLLSKYLSAEEFEDYTHFVTMKAKLVMDQRELEDKIKLGEEQLAALKEALHVRPKV